MPVKRHTYPKILKTLKLYHRNQIKHKKLFYFSIEHILCKVYLLLNTLHRFDNEKRRCRKCYDMSNGDYQAIKAQRFLKNQ